MVFAGEQPSGLFPATINESGTITGRVPTGGVGRTEQAARKRALHSAVASERLAAVIADSRVGSDCESQRNRGTRR